MLTSGQGFEGYEIVEYLGFVNVQSVLSSNFFKGFAAGVSEMSDSESEKLTGKLEQVNETALKRLQTIRHPRIITVQEKKIVSLRSVDAPSSGKKLTGVLLMNHSNSWILFRVSIQELCAAVFRAIVNNDQFPIRHALCLHRRNASV